MEDQSIIDHIVEMKGDIASIKTTLEETVRPLVVRVDSHEHRLSATESDVRMCKRIWGGLFTLVIAAGAATANWLKGT